MTDLSRINDDERREALFRLGHTLTKLKNDMAYHPGGVPDLSTRIQMQYCIRILADFQVSTLQLQAVEDHSDVWPLANLYNMGVQILALREIQNKLKCEVREWRSKVEAIQASTPVGTDDIGLVIAETHEFLIFATWVNRIHPVSTLSRLSIARATQKARESEPIGDASHIVSLLKAAFSVQRELEQPGLSAPGCMRMISNATSLPQATISIAREWYENYQQSIPDVEKRLREQAKLLFVPFDCLLTWFINSRRRVLASKQSIRPAIVAVGSHAAAAVEQLSINRKKGNNFRFNYRETHSVGNGDHGTKEEIPLVFIIDNFLSDLGELSKSMPLEEQPMANFPGSDSPIRLIPTDFPVNRRADMVTQQAQSLLRNIYGSYNSAAYWSLEIVKRAHWLDADKKLSYAIKAKGEINNNYLHSLSTLVMTQRINKAFFPEQRVTAAVEFPTISSSRVPLRSGLMETVFRVAQDPNTAEEEFLAEITGMNMNQVHTWFLYKRNIKRRPSAGMATTQRRPNDS